ncbi:MAG: thiamine pyrophosphate-dependent dehydrogenase E1 component subunit alpha [Thermodesulfobacteriota bacterium]
MYARFFLEKLYQTMLRIRLCEESFVEPILNGEIRCPVHLYSGQEAIATGVCAALKKGDYVFGNHRSHGHYLAKGGSLEELVGEVYCMETGCSKGRGGSMHIIDPEKGMMGSVPIVAGTIPLAVGAALASRIRKEKRVTVSFFGDGATGEGVLYESLNFASLKKLPMIFACENNLYSTHMPIEECRVRKRISEISSPFCVENHRVDGNDVLKVYEISKEAAERCRQGQGPIFLEFVTYRLRGHVGPDDNVQGMHMDIRSKEELDRWQKRDPLKRFERWLLKDGVFTARDLQRMEQVVKKEVAEAHLSAKRSDGPDKAGLREYVYR